MSSKCGICNKSVYPMDPQINLDGSIYHTVCAKCEDCRCQITISNFTKSGDTLLCKTHYFKRFNEQGNYMGGEKFAQKSSRGNNTAFSPPPPPSSESASSAPTNTSSEQEGSESTTDATSSGELSQPDLERRKSLQDRMKAFGGTGGSQTKCATCQRSVYPNDPQIALDGVVYHKECAKCTDCNCQITLANFCKFGTTLYCKTHYFKRFKEEGGYLGDDKYAHKSSSGAYIAKEASFVPKADGSGTNTSATTSEESGNNETATNETTTNESESIPNLESDSNPQVVDNQTTNDDTTPPVETAVEPTETDSNSNEPPPSSENV